MNSLNKQQQQLVEKNHNLIYSFAKSRKIDIEEYYDVLAIALCRAALVYDENKGMFSTLAYKYMSNEYSNCLRLSTAYKRIPNSLIDSLDEVLNYDDDENEITLYNYVKQNKFPIPDDSAITSISIQNFYNNQLNQQEQKVFIFLLQKYTQAEISNLMLLSRQRIGIIIKNIRKKWIKLFF